MAAKAGEGGAYRLYIYLSRRQTITAGRLGEVTLKRGLYAYCGSARGGLRQRLARHLRLGKTKQGKLHWHVDYLLTNPFSRVVAFSAHPGEGECAQVHALSAKPGVLLAHRGFGATDCREGCMAHLLYLGNLGALEKYIDGTEQRRWRRWIRL